MILRLMLNESAVGTTPASPSLTDRTKGDAGVAPTHDKIPVLRIVRSFLVGLLIFALTGCTPQAYKRSADRQVHQILEDRKERTLGYTPQSVAEGEIPPPPAKPAYRRIPLTVIPPPIVSPLEPTPVELRYEPMGPASPESGEMGESQTSAEAVRAVEQRVDDRLALGPPSPDELAVILNLFGSLEYAVEHSREYQSAMEDLYLAALGVTLERHLFGPRPFVRTSLDYSGGQGDVDYRSALAVTTSAGIRQQLPYGGEIVAQALVQFVDTLNGNSANGESAALVLSGSIPLLRGAGLVNLEPLINSERQLIYEVRGFESFRRDFLVDVASQYFRLLTQQQAVNNRRLNYTNLATLTERTEALYEAGRLNFLEVQRALQGQLSAENSLIDAQDSYRNALDNFKLVIGMPVDKNLEIVPTALDVAPPDIEGQDVVAVALKYRLDLQTARDLIEDARRGVAVAANGLLPDLDLTASTEVGNREGTPAGALDERTLTYSAGVTLDLPIDRLAERNAYRRSLINFERTQRGFERTQDQIIADVRDSVRQIRSAEASLQIQQRGIELAQRRLEFATELLIQGKEEARDVLEAQQSLLTAQDAYERAKADLQIQILQFLRDTGTLRVDPQAGALGEVLDRTGFQGNKNEIEP